MKLRTNETKERKLRKKKESYRLRKQNTKEKRNKNTTRDRKIERKNETARGRRRKTARASVCEQEIGREKKRKIKSEASKFFLGCLSPLRLLC